MGNYKYIYKIIYIERVWSIDISKDSSNYMAFGFDEGTVVVKIGSEEPVVSMKFYKLFY